MISIATPMMWTLFTVFVVLALVVDLLMLKSTGPHKVTTKEALIWSLFWIALSMVFNYGLWWYLRDSGHPDADRIGMEFLTGYLVEKALAVDNIFVFLLIFNYFAVPPQSQQRVLIYGVLGAIVLRAILIFVGAVLILEGGMRTAYRTVESVTGTTVAFEESDASAWPAPARLSPSLDGYLDESIPAPLTSRTHGIVEASITFHVDPGSEPIEDQGAASATLNGREVFLAMPNRWQEIGIDRLQNGAAAVDYGFGRVRRFFPINWSTRMWEAQYTQCDFEHADLIRKFFDRMKGRCREFYMPTWQNDLEPVGGISGTTLTVEGTETDAVYSGSTVWKAVAIRKTDGTWLTSTVTDMSASGGNSVLTLSTSLTVAHDDIAQVSWLPVWRFSSDAMTMSWPKEDVAEIKLPMQMLENLAVE